MQPQLLSNLKQIANNIQSAPELLSEYNALVDRLHALPTGPNPFEALPNELIYQIFTEFVLDLPEGVVTLSLICTQWRQLTHQNAALWTRIVINTNKPEWKSRLKAFHALSRDRLVDVTLYTPFSVEGLKPLLKDEHLFRWRSLSVLDSRTKEERSLWPWQRRADDSVHLLSLFQDRSFSNLRNIDVRVKATTTARAPTLWSSIFTTANLPLNRIMIQPLLLSHLTVNMFYVGFEQLLDILEGVPNLLFLKLSLGRTSGDDLALQADTLVPLHHLREIKSGEGVPIAKLLSKLDCPNLHSLEAECFRTAFDGMYRKLQHLRLLKRLRLVLYCTTLNPFSIETPPIALDDFQLEHRYTPSSGSSIPVLTETVYPTFLDPLFQLFSPIRRVKLSTNQSLFTNQIPQSAWANTLSLINHVESLSIEENRANPRSVQKAPNRLTPISLPSLQSLMLTGPLCSAVLSLIEAPKLKELYLIGMSDFDPEALEVLMRVSSTIRTLHLDNLPHNAVYSTPYRILYPVEDLITSHSLHLTFGNHLNSKVRTLRLIGVLQGVAMKRGKFHFDQREIHLNTFQPRDILHTVTHLDLCVSSDLFPVVIGLDTVLPALEVLEKISLPRALLTSNVLVDELLRHMLQALSSCPRLKEIYTEDYPDWTALTDLVTRRNLTGLIEERYTKDQPFPGGIQCLYLPALPHQSILSPLQEVLAGKLARIPDKAPFGDDQ